MIKYKQKLDSLLNKSRENKIIKIRLDELNFHPELAQAFKINDDVKKRIEDDVKVNGNNTKAHPIHIFKMNDKWYVSDGHTRVTVLRELGFTYVYAQVHIFNNISEALCNTMAEQFNRRNESDADLLSRYLMLRDQIKDGKKLTADELASKLNKSRRHIFKLQTVFSKSSPQQLDAIKEGSATINSVYQEIKKQEAEVVKVIPSAEIDDLAATEVNESSADELPKEELIAKEKTSISTPAMQTSPKTSKVTKSSYQEGYSAGIRYAIDSLANGKTPEDLLSELDA